MEASIITTYRCISHCQMCHIWKHPTQKEEEFKPSLLEKLPPLSFCNITGGEPFLREDIGEIVEILKRRAHRIVISTNGYLTDNILTLAQKHGHIGIRISLEGLPEANDELRGMKDSFDRGFRTLLELKRMGMKDIGIATTISGKNANDMLKLYRLAKGLKWEFATAVVHNSYYFHKYNNATSNKEEVIRAFKTLIGELLKTWRVKNWFRAYFNQGLIQYIEDRPRLLPCTAGTDIFFVDPLGEIRPCNGMEESLWFESMGNLNEKPFGEILHSEKAKQVREMVKHCPKNCWMVGTASPAMKRQILKTTFWVIKNKIKSLI